jgi:hypothetical protein
LIAIKDLENTVNPRIPINKEIKNRTNIPYNKIKIEFAENGKVKAMEVRQFLNFISRRAFIDPNRFKFQYLNNKEIEELFKQAGLFF